MNRLFLFVLAAVAGSSVGQARLVWEKTEVSVAAAPFDEQADVAFTFTNAGGQPVTIVSATSSCGCTIPSLARRTFAPDEKGEIRAVFQFEGRTGRQDKFITVSTDEPGQPQYELTLTVEIPQLFNVLPQLLVWRSDEPPTEKTISVRALMPDAARPTAIESRDTRFAVRLEPDAADAALWRVLIKPESTATAMQASVIVQTNAPEHSPRVITLFALVREAPRPAPAAAAQPQ